MKNFLLTFLCFFCTTASATDFDYSAYKATALAAAEIVVQINPEAKIQFELDSSHPRYRSEVIFTGRTRILMPEVKTLLQYWVKAMGHPKQYEELFASEIEVKQGDRVYWMPIQRQLAEPFMQEIKLGGKVTLYLLRLGAIQLDTVFCVSEFDAAE